MIGGNITAQLQIKSSNGRNAIGETVTEYTTVNRLVGFLDYSTGESKYQNYDSKILESSHIFICDYVPLDDSVEMSGENSRMVIDGKRYDVKLIDDVMNLHKHYEIYLQYTGAQ